LGLLSRFETLFSLVVFDMSKKETGRDSAGAKDAVALGSPAVAKVAVLSVCIFGLIEVLRVVLLQS